MLLFILRRSIVVFMVILAVTQLSGCSWHGRTHDSRYVTNTLQLEGPTSNITTSRYSCYTDDHKPCGGALYAAHLAFLNSFCSGKVTNVEVSKGYDTLTEIHYVVDGKFKHRYITHEQRQWLDETGWCGYAAPVRRSYTETRSSGESLRQRYKYVPQ